MLKSNPFESASFLTRIGIIMSKFDFIINFVNLSFWIILGATITLNKNHYISVYVKLILGHIFINQFGTEWKINIFKDIKSKS